MVGGDLRILIGGVFTTAFAGAAYVWPEIFGAWFSEYIGGAFVFVSVYSLGSGFSQKALKGVARGIREGLIDSSADLQRPLARYLDRGANLDQVLLDHRSLKQVKGFDDSLARFRDFLRAEDFSGADNIVAEWRAISRGGGHSVGDLDFISTKVDSAGRPLRFDASNPFTELDGKLKSGDIMEVKNSLTGQGVIDQYFKSGQHGKHSQLLSIYHGKEIKLYVRSSVKTEVESYLTSEGITNVKVYTIP